MSNNSSTDILFNVLFSGEFLLLLFHPEIPLRTHLIDLYCLAYWDLVVLDFHQLAPDYFCPRRLGLVCAPPLVHLQLLILPHPSALLMFAFDLQLVDDVSGGEVGLQAAPGEGILAQGADLAVGSPTIDTGETESVATAQALRILKNILADGTEKMLGYAFKMHEHDLTLLDCASDHLLDLANNELQNCRPLYTHIWEGFLPSHILLLMLGGRTAEGRWEGDKIVILQWQYSNWWMPFSEEEPRNLSLVVTLTESDKRVNTEYWPNLICYIGSSIHRNTFYVIYPAKPGTIDLLHIENDCLMAKKTFKLVYAVHNKITALKALYTPSGKNKTISILIGYENNVVDVCTLTENEEKGLCFMKIRQVQLVCDKKQPVVSMHLYEDLVVVCMPYQISFISGMLGKQVSSLSEQKMKFKTAPTSRMNVEINAAEGVINIYNDESGLETYEIKTMKKLSHVQDSIRTIATLSELHPKGEQSLMIASMDNCIKIIEYDLNLVIKYVGFKNYVNCSFIDTANNCLWVGCLDGSISCFSHKPVSSSFVPSKQVSILERQLKHRMQVCENGISNIFILNNLMVMKDCEHNIYLWDILKVPVSSNRATSSRGEQTE